MQAGVRRIRPAFPGESETGMVRPGAEDLAENSP